MKQQEEYITYEEKAKELEKYPQYKELMTFNALSTISKINKHAKRKITKIIEILNYFDKNAEELNINNLTGITVRKEGNEEEKTSNKKTIEFQVLYDFIVYEKAIYIKESYTLENFPIEVLGLIFHKIAIKKFLLKCLEESSSEDKEKKHLPKSKKKNTNTTPTIELQPSQIKKINEIYINNTKLSNHINKIPLSNEETGATIYIDKAKKIPTILKMTNINYTDEEIKIKGFSKINYFDKFVHDTVCTFWEQGQTDITPTMILRAMRGNPKQKDFSRQQVEAVTKSLNKMRCTLIEIDATQEARLKKWIDKDSKMIFKSYLLPLTGITILTGGNTLDGFNIIDCPPLWAYTQETNQRITVKDDLIKNLSFDKHGIIYYLIHRLHLIKYKQSDTRKNNSNIIILEKMFTELDLIEEFKDKKQKKKILDNITKNLDVWIKQKDIKHYEVITEGKVKSKIKILI